METKLENIDRQYRMFVENQVLTSGQLNEVLDYFENQDRLSRVLLTGTGIICGLETKIEDDQQIVVSQGIGITTDGDILFLDHSLKEEAHPFKIRNFSYKHFREFEDKNAHYPLFKNGEDKNISLYELVHPDKDGAKEIDALENWKEMGVVLYLESYKKQKDICTTQNCDNQGEQQVNHLRLLLIDKEDLKGIQQKDELFTAFNIQEEVAALPIIEIKRNVLNSDKVQSAESLKESYTAIVEGVIAELQSAIKTLCGIKGLYKNFEVLLKSLEKEADKNSDSTYLNKLKNKMPNTQFQYHYDAIKDIVWAWNELRTHLREFIGTCIPDVQAFPKHLLLGDLKNRNSNRHRFYKSHALITNKESKDHVQNLLSRFYLLLKNFTLSNNKEVKITPSIEHSELGKKAIPFYYQVNDQLLEAWNYHLTQKNNQDQNLSYHRDNLSRLPQIQRPLEYDLSRFDFFRIEGHQGKNYKQALEEIIDLKKLYGLAFDIKALPLYIDDIEIDIEDYAVEFEDLSLLLKIWTEEQDCILKEATNLLTSFDIEEPGKNQSKGGLGRMKPVIEPARLLDSQLFSAKTTPVFKGEPLDKQVFRSGVYDASSSVRSAVSNTQNTLGVFLNDLPEMVSELSSEDLSKMLIARVEKKLDASKWKDEEELKEMAVYQPLELFSEIIFLSDKRPVSLAGLSNYGLWEYDFQIDSFCKKLQKIKDTYQKPNENLSPELKNTINLMISQLSGVCCSAKKLKTVKKKIEERKQEILSSLIFSSFSKRHVGLEHRAGVMPGGTFMMVYLNKEQKANLDRIDLNPAEEKKILEVFKKEEIAQIRSFFNKDELQNLRGVNTPKKENVSAIERKINKISGRFSAIKDIDIPANTIVSTLVGQIKGVDKLPERERLSDIPLNTVIADFSLPYVCCSDSTPVNFIIQKPPATLQLEKDKVCLGKEPAELFYNVSPEDGTIQPDRSIEGMEIKANKIVLNPEEISETDFGKTIRFTVNQQVTTAEMTIFKAPEVDFIWKETGNDNEFRFEISAVSKDIDNWEFSWDFGDGHSSDEKTPVHRYKTEEYEALTLIVKLRVLSQDGNCPGYAEKEIVIEPVEIEIDLDKKDFCANDDKNYPFIINPKDAEIKIEGRGVIEENDQYFFVPSKVKVDSEITFMVNGKNTGLQVNVHPLPKADFEWKQDSNNLLLKNNSQNADSVRWYINGQEVNLKNENPFIYNIDSAGSSELLILLKAENKYCGTDEFSETIKINIENDQENNCIDNTGKQIEADYQALIEMRKFKEVDIQKLLTDTTELYKKKSSGIDGVLDNLNENLKGKNNLLFFDKIERLLLSTHSVIQKYKQDDKKINELKPLLDLQLALFNNLIKCQDEHKLNPKEAAKFKAIWEIIQKINLEFNSREPSKDPFKNLLSQDVSKMKMKDLIDIVNKNRNIFK